MDIKTKYSIGDTVYIIDNNAIKECDVVCIDIKIEKDYRRYEKYQVAAKSLPGVRMKRDVSQLFDTVEGLVRHSTI